MASPGHKKADSCVGLRTIGLRPTAILPPQWEGKRCRRANPRSRHMEKPSQAPDRPDSAAADRPLLRAAFRGVTRRALALTAVLAPANTWWLYQMQEVWSVGNPTILSLYFNVVFVLCLLVLLNKLLRVLRPAWALTQPELLVVYVLLSITTSCGAYDFLHWFLPNIAGVAYRAVPENRWREVFFDYLPRAMTMQDETSLRGLYEGGTSFYTTPEAWRPWVEPASWWVVMTSLLWVAPLGLAVLFRRRWIEVEKLSYPIVQLPFEVTRDRSPYFRDRTLWLAFGIAFTINLMNGLKVIKPMFPAIPVKVAWDPGGGTGFNISQSLTEAPWNAATNVSLAFYPIIIGFGLLLPTELALSCWVFFFLFKGQLVLVRWLGLQGKPEFPFLKEQSLGGYLGILVFSLWVGRAYYADMARRVLKRDPERDSREPISYRAATMLFLLCLGGVVAIAVNMGMGLWQAAFLWVMYYVLTLVCGRIRAEMGLPVHEIERLGPTVLLGNVFGRRIAGEQSLTVASLYFGISRGFRSIAFPHQAEGFKLMERSGGSTRRLFYAMAVVTVLGMAVSWLIYLPVVYQYGAGTAKMKQYSNWHTYETYNQLMSWLEEPRPLALGGFAMHRVTPALLGLAFYLVMMTLKTRVSWWPLHPVGFALSTTWYMHHMWCPFFVAWVTKWLMARYAGHSGTRTLVPIAFGLILGDTISGCLWTIYGAFTQREVYAFWN